MRSKRQIERQLEHFKTDCPTPGAERETWIAALEWVLGDETHRHKYDAWIDMLQESTALEPNPGSLNERLLRLHLATTLERLR